MRRRLIWQYFLIGSVIAFSVYESITATVLGSIVLFSAVF
jgi:hypothetical protein